MSPAGHLMVKVLHGNAAVKCHENCYPTLHQALCWNSSDILEYLYTQFGEGIYQGKSS